MRRGFTLTEVLVVAAIAIGVLAAVLNSWRSGSQAERVANSTGALQSAMLLTETLYRDICQLGIDQTSREPLMINEGSLCFYKVKFQGDLMKLVPVKFSRVKSPQGNWFLKREEAGEKPKTYGGAPCTELSFVQIQDPKYQTRYIRVTMKVMESDLAPGPARREPLAHSSIMRIPVPSQIGHPGLQAVMRIVPEGPLLQLD